MADAVYLPKQISDVIWPLNYTSRLHQRLFDRNRAHHIAVKAMPTEAKITSPTRARGGMVMDVRRAHIAKRNRLPISSFPQAELADEATLIPVGPTVWIANTGAAIAKVYEYVVGKWHGLTRHEHYTLTSGVITTNKWWFRKTRH